MLIVGPHSTRVIEKVLPRVMPAFSAAPGQRLQVDALVEREFGDEIDKAEVRGIVLVPVSIFRREDLKAPTCLWDGFHNEVGCFPKCFVGGDGLAHHVVPYDE